MSLTNLEWKVILILVRGEIAKYKFQEEPLTGEQQYRYNRLLEIDAKICKTFQWEPYQE